MEDQSHKKNLSPNKEPPLPERYVSERILQPVLSEMRFAIFAAAPTHPDGPGVVHVAAVRRWMDTISQQLPQQRETDARSD